AGVALTPAPVVKAREPAGTGSCDRGGVAATIRSNVPAPGDRLTGGTRSPTMVSRATHQHAGQKLPGVRSDPLPLAPGDVPPYLPGTSSAVAALRGTFTGHGAALAFPEPPPAAAPHPENSRRENMNPLDISRLDECQPGSSCATPLGALPARLTGSSRC